MMTVRALGSVRVDLLGGTLDLSPINHVIPNVVTLNLATSLKADVSITASEKNGVTIISKDYESEHFFKREEFTQELLRGSHFGPLSFVAQILVHLNLTSHVSITLQSGSPAGAGLGGSSAMGVTLYQAICQYKKGAFDRLAAIREVGTIEAQILNSGPAGYQDYYPALYGGILALKAVVGGVEVEQLFSQKLKNYLENHLTLVYSGQTRLSGINNWEVYKRFFDGDCKTREGLTSIAQLSVQGYQAIASGDFARLIDLIGREGELRKDFFPNIQTKEMDILHEKLIELDHSIKLKVCGAGGGGCFLICHPQGQKKEIEAVVGKHKMVKLDFSIEEPL